MDNKKTIAGIPLFIMLLLNTFAVYAQSDPAAKSLLDKMSSTYKGYKAIEATFSITATQATQTATAYSQSGTVLIEPATGKYHITLDNQEMISDGKSLWTILKDVQEVQITEADNSDVAVSPANIFSFYTNGYKYVSAPNERVGNTSLLVVELSPEDTHSPYYKIKLRIHPTSNLIQDVTVFDKNSTRYVYHIKNSNTKPTVSADSFTFQQGRYPGLEIVDLR